MKRLYLNIFLCLIFACNQQSKRDSPHIDQNIPKKEEIRIDEVIFGVYCGECTTNCAPMYKFNPIEKTLYADYEDNYFEGIDQLKFKTKITQKEKLEIADEILNKLPRTLSEWKSNFVERFGCPDCTDGCGVYLELRVQNQRKSSFELDLYQTSDHDPIKIPEEILYYANFIAKKVDLLSEE